MINNASFFCSWSGGKDSALALYQAIKAGGKPSYLLTILTEDGQRSRSHGLETSLIKEQASALNIPVVFCSASWKDYETVFTAAVCEFKKQGIDFGVFGDIDIERNKAWVEKVCSVASASVYHPLWKKPRPFLIRQLVESGFKALDLDLMKEMESIGIDICGENGEYHTVVIDGPIFSKALDLNIKDKVLKDGYWFLDVSAGKESFITKNT